MIISSVARPPKASVCHPFARNATLAKALALLSVGFVWSGSAYSETKFKPYAGISYERNSNVFAVADDSNAPILGSSHQTADTDISYFAGLNSAYLVGNQRFFLVGEWRRINYNKFNELGNTQYFLDGGWNFKFTSAFEGTAGYRQERRQQAFSEQFNRTPTEVNIRTGHVDLIIHVGPDWRLEPKVRTKREETPQPGFPDFRLDETTTGLGLMYAGIGNLSFGIEGLHSDGKFKDGPPGLEYKQDTAQFAAKYVVSDLTDFDGAIGYTKRKQNQQNDSISGMTGSIGYTRKLTGKTTMDLRIVRALDSYVATGASNVNTGITLGFAWQATGKTLVSPAISWTRRTFEGQALPGAVSEGRVDKEKYAGLIVTYEALRWLQVRPYVKYTSRDSNIGQFTYDSTSIGLDLRATLPE